MAKKAKYQISSSVNEGILEIVLTGEVANDDMETVMKKIFAFRKSIDTNNELIDVRTLKGRFGIVETYAFIGKIHSNRPRVNIAFVDVIENKVYNSYHEATAIKAGISFKWFTDIDAARDWIKSK
jgi:hypothetical protein